MSELHRILPDSAQSLDDVLRFSIVKEGVDEVKFRKLSETQKTGFSASVLSKMVESIKNKTMQADYSAIASTGGDVTKFKGYSDLDASVNFLMNMYNRDKHAPKVIPELQKALRNLVQYKTQFMQGFDQENEIVTYLYNNLVVSVVSATSIVVASTVEYVKDPLGIYSAKFKAGAESVANSDMYFDAVTKFNKYEQKGILRSFFDSTLKVQNFSAKGFSASSVSDWFKNNKAIGITLASLASIALFIFVLREVVYLFYWGRNVFSAKLEHLGVFVQMNASTLGEDKKKVKEKQEKIARILLDLSDKISVDAKVSGRKASDEIKREDSKTNFGSVASEGDIL